STERCPRGAAPAARLLLPPGGTTPLARSHAARGLRPRRRRAAPLDGTPGWHTARQRPLQGIEDVLEHRSVRHRTGSAPPAPPLGGGPDGDRKSTRLNSSHVK